MIIAEKMFPEYGRDEFFLSQTERIALNACLEAVRIEVAGKVELNRSGSARSKVGRSIPQGDFHSGDGGGRGVRAYSARTAHPFQRNGAPFRFKLSKAQQVD